MGNTYTKIMIEVKEKTKDLELNSVLDKIRNKQKLSEYELQFLCEFDSIPEIDHTNFSHLSKNQVFDKLTYLLSKSKKIICDLKDKDGKINEEIIKISNDFENDYCVLILKNNLSCKLFDNYFYKITYNFSKNFYTLEVQDEFYEKINVENED